MPIGSSLLHLNPKAQDSPKTFCKKAFGLKNPWIRVLGAVGLGFRGTRALVPFEETELQSHRAEVPMNPLRL